MKILLSATKEMPDTSFEVIMKIEATDITDNLRFMYPDKYDNWIMWKAEFHIIEEIRALYPNYSLVFNMLQMTRYPKTTAIFDFTAFPNER